MTASPLQRPESWWSVAAYLARSLVARRYAGSLLGSLWALVFPALQVAVYWAVLVFGLKVKTDTSVSLAAVLIAGITPWFAFSDAVANMTLSISSNPSLVKRVVLPVEILPVANLIAALIAHSVIFVLAVAALWTLGYPPTLHLLLAPYYTACLGLFALAVGTVLALANVVFRDVSQLVGSFLGLGLWATPILWSVSALAPHLQWIERLNPMAYVVAGYRSALIGPRVAAPDLSTGLCFWGVTGVAAVVAYLLFQRFKRELADML
jgi:ABC-type polysaccharide/polyol phosphate export permease